MPDDDLTDDFDDLDDNQLARFAAHVLSGELKIEKDEAGELMYRCRFASSGYRLTFRGKIHALAFLDGQTRGWRGNITLKDKKEKGNGNKEEN